MTPKPAISFLTGDSDAMLATDVGSILNKLAGNQNFPSPTPALNVVSTALNAFTVALAAAVEGGLSFTLAKNARRAELVALVRTLATYVQLASQGDMTKLLSSGFPVQKSGRTPVGPLPAPAAPRIAQGTLTGSLNAATSPVRGAVSYNWSVALQSAPDVDVQSAITSAARTTFSGLTPGQVYLVCLTAVGAAGPSDWSDYGTLMVI
jgi:hypothetical protein